MKLNQNINKNYMPQKNIINKYKQKFLKLITNNQIIVIL